MEPAGMDWIALTAIVGCMLVMWVLALYATALV